MLFYHITVFYDTDKLTKRGTHIYDGYILLCTLKPITNPTDLLLLRVLQLFSMRK
jgi:hypothetical protein